MSNIIEQNVVNKGSDVQFLLYLHEMLKMSNIQEGSDSMYRLRNIILGTDINKRTKLDYKDASVVSMENTLLQRMNNSSSCSSIKGGTSDAR